MIYHMNHEGLVLPCLHDGKQRCTYSTSRHSTDPFDFFHESKSRYTRVTPSKELLNTLKKNKLINNISLANDDILNADNPVAMICSVYQYALIYSSNFHLDNDAKYVIDQYESNRNSNKRYRDATPYEHTELVDYRSRVKENKSNRKRYNQAIKDIESGKISSKELKKYRTDLKDSLAHWGYILNVYNLVNQPEIIRRNDNLSFDTLEKLTDDQLLSLYDHCTISDSVVLSELDSLSNFIGLRLEGASFDVNSRLTDWGRKTQQMEHEYIVGGVRRIQIANGVVRLLKKRGYTKYGNTFPVAQKKEKIIPIDFRTDLEITDNPTSTAYLDNNKTGDTTDSEEDINEKTGNKKYLDDIEDNPTFIKFKTPNNIAAVIMLVSLIFGSFFKFGDFGYSGLQLTSYKLGVLLFFVPFGILSIGFVDSFKDKSRKISLICAWAGLILVLLLLIKLSEIGHTIPSIQGYAYIICNLFIIFGPSKHQDEDNQTI